MANLQEEVTSTFIEKLEASSEFTQEMLDQLRHLFSDGKKLRVNDLMDIFSNDTDQTVQ